MIESFHFVHPAWLLALVPLALLLWLLRRREGPENPWRRVVDEKLLPLLLVEGEGGARQLPWWLLALGWLVAVLALADPTWEKQPRPVFQSAQARVMVLDLSASMNATDLKPSRLVRARYKVADILSRGERGLEEGRNALVAFAGDAFVVAPLTRDGETIVSMLQVLDPGIMPVQGSRVDRGLAKAGELLRQAGAGKGEVLLLTDGFAAGAREETLAAARKLRDRGHRVSVLGVGTTEGAPVPTGKGSFLRDAAGSIVVPRLDPDSLRQLARAGGGRYATISGDDSDLDGLLRNDARFADGGVQATEVEGEAWVEQGPWLVLLLLPLAALAFRRGWLLGLLLLAGVAISPPPAMAAVEGQDEAVAGAASREEESPFAWQGLWLRPDQRAVAALEAGDPERAAKVAEDPLLRGAARYRQGDFERALEDFTRAQGADADYNRGNALARLGKYREAIDAYDEALAQAPEMTDARVNKAAVEELLRRQEEEEKKQQKQQDRQEDQEGRDGEQAQRQGSQGQKSAGQENAGQPGKEGEQGGNPQAGGGEKPQQQDTTGRDGKEEERQPGGSSGKGGESAAPQEQGGSAGAAEPEAGAGQEEGGSAAGEDEQNGQDRDNQFARAAEAVKQQGNGQENDQEEKGIGPGQATASPPEPSEPGKRDAAPTGRQEEGDPGEEEGKKSAAVAAANDLTTEEQMAAEQWLRRIPDDPGGLLRRKFFYQYRQRPPRPGAGAGSEQPW